MESEWNAKLWSTLVFFFWCFSKIISKMYIHVPYILSASSSHSSWQSRTQKAAFAKWIFKSKYEWLHFYLLCSQIQWNYLLLEKELKWWIWKYKAKLCKIITHTETKYVLKVSVIEVLLSYFCWATLNLTENSTLLHPINAPNWVPTPVQKDFTCCRSKFRTPKYLNSCIPMLIVVQFQYWDF